MFEMWVTFLSGTGTQWSGTVQQTNHERRSVYTNYERNTIIKISVSTSYITTPQRHIRNANIQV